MRAAFLLLMLCGSLGHAEPMRDDPIQRAEQAMQRGIAATARGDHERALAAFLEAAQLAPDANLPHKLAGEALEALGRYVDAIAEYRRYIAVKPDAKGVAEIQARIGKLEREHTATLEVRCNILGAFVEIDGAPVGRTPVAPVIVVAPARKTLSIKAPGYLKQTEDVAVKPGSQVSFQCALDPAPTDGRLDQRMPEAAGETHWYRRWQVIVPAVGVVAALVGTGLYIALSDKFPTTDGGSHQFP